MLLDLLAGFWLPMLKTKMERSDTAILGILDHFRHFPIYPG
jgi:hypothetical protein